MLLEILICSNLCLPVVSKLEKRIADGRVEWYNILSGYFVEPDRQPG